MNIDSNHFEQQEPTKCKSCRLFFGSEDFEGLCSSCFKKTEKENQTSVTKATDKLQIQSIEQKAIVQVVKKEQKVQKEQKEQAPSMQIDKKKCFQCKRKLGIMGNECKCGFVFCNAHRLPEVHSCSFDFHDSGKKKLEKELQKVYNGKITQI